LIPTFRALLTLRKSSASFKSSTHRSNNRWSRPRQTLPFAVRNLAFHSYQQAEGYSKVPEAVRKTKEEKLTRNITELASLESAIAAFASLVKS
jgi:hypothetical protein